MSILQTCLARKNEVGASAVLKSADQLTRKTLMENVDSDGLNALHYAAYYGCHKTLKLMLDDISQHELPGEISRIFTEKDKNSFQNILHYAASEGQFACVELILKHVQDKHEIKNELLQAMMSPSGNQPIQDGFFEMSYLGLKSVIWGHFLSKKRDSKSFLGQNMLFWVDFHHI